MGSRKRNSAEKIKEAKKDLAFAKLNNCPTSPRKMRLVADQIRGEDISSALSILQFSPKEASRRLEKLLVSAISNWQSKNENADIDSAQLFVKEIRVDSAGMLKRIRTKGKVVALESANKNYETKIFGPDRVKVQGVLVSLYRNF